MPQDAFTLNYLAKEFNSLLVGGKINKVITPSNDQVVFTVYNGKTYRLLIDVNPSCPRIGLIDDDLTSPLTAPNFCMLLRKHLLNAEIKDISIVDFDRIVKITLLSSSEFFDSKEKVLFIELMGRYSNIVITENNLVLGGNRGINMFDDGVRPLIVGLPYSFPPTNNKILPSDDKLIELIKDNNEDFADFIVKKVQGLALDTVKKCINDYNVKYGENAINKVKENAKIFFEFFNEFIFNSKSSPVVVLKDDTVKDVCAFSYNSYDTTIKFDFLYQAEEYYFSERQKNKIFKENKDRVNSVVSASLKKAKKRLDAILSRINDAKDLEKNKLFGELLISNLYRLKNGEKQAIVENYYDDYKEVVIPLDSTISVRLNAENYYKKYNKQKRSLVFLELQKEQAEQEVVYFESLLSFISLAENTNDIMSVLSELEEGGFVKKQPLIYKKKVENKPYREYEVNGFTIKVGRNNIENDRLTFSSKPENIWLHAKDYHSSHIIIELNGKKIDKAVLLTACEICAYYSKGREGGKTEIVVTERKNVKKPPKTKAGFFTYSDFTSYCVMPNKHENLLKN